MSEPTEDDGISAAYSLISMYEPTAELAMDAMTPEGRQLVLRVLHKIQGLLERGQQRGETPWWHFPILSRIRRTIVYLEEDTDAGDDRAEGVELGQHPG